MSGQRTMSLEDLVAEWSQAGLITTQQRDSLMSSHPGAHVRDVPVSTRARGLAFEGLGYLGGAIIVAAALMLTLEYWADLGDAVRLAITGCAWAALLLAGAVVGASAAEGLAGRLRSVLWVAAVPASAAVAFVVGDWTGLRDADLGVLVAGSAAALAAVLWRLWRSPLQQVAAFVALGGASAAVIAQQASSDWLPGLGPWTVGVAWIGLAATGRTMPRRLGLAAGSAIAIFGSMVTAQSDIGMALLVVTLTGVAVAALALSDLLMLAVGSVGIVLNVPQAADRWFPGSVAAPLALLAAGTLVVILAVVAARRGRVRHPAAADR